VQIVDTKDEFALCTGVTEYEAEFSTGKDK
jgi:hypothetical protein